MTKLEQEVVTTTNHIAPWIEDRLPGLLSSLAPHEGIRLRFYHCTAGFKTIGCGRNADVKPLPPEWTPPLTVSQVASLLVEDIEDALKGARTLPGWEEYPPVVRSFLVEFVFNVGLGTALKFKKSLALLQQREWDLAADEFRTSLWSQQVGRRAKRMTDTLRELPSEKAAQK